MIDQKIPKYTEEEVLADIKYIKLNSASRSIPCATSNNKKLVLPIYQSYGDNSASKVKAHKVEDKLYVVEGIHKKVQDEHGNVFKNLSKTFSVSENYDFNDAKITLVLDGTLTIYIPCKVEPLADENCTIKSPYNNEPTEEI